MENAIKASILIPETAVEAAAEAAYEVVRPRMGFPTGFAEAPEFLKDTYRQIARASLEAGTQYLVSDAGENEARADELDQFVAYMKSPQPRLIDSYTRRKLSEEAVQRAASLRGGTDES